MAVAAEGGMVDSPASSELLCRARAAPVSMDEVDGATLAWSICRVPDEVYWDSSLREPL